MKTILKRTCTFAAAAIAAVGCFSLAVFITARNPGSAQTVWAEPVQGMPAQTLSFLENMQAANRSISSAILPAVVTLDVVETKTVETDAQNGYPWFFFGNPNQQGNNQEGENGQSQREYKAEGLGSGVIIRQAGNVYYLLTNQHVAGSANEIQVKLFDGREYPGKLVGADDRKDIALVSFETKESGIPVAKLGDSDAVKTGDIVFAVGSPLGYVSSVTQGIVSAVGRDGGPNGNINDFIQTDAAINQGNSGGPLVNIYGEVVGINAWIASSTGGSQGLGFSIPINNVKTAIDDFISDGKVKYGWLGVSLVQMDKNFLSALGVTEKNGAFVSQVFIGSPAEKGGLSAGDFIVSLEGKDVKSVDQLVRDVGDLKSGQTVRFGVINNGKRKDISVKIEERKDSVVSDSSTMWPGFTPYPITDEIRKELKLDSKAEGVVVSGVQPKSPAAIVGLQSGDVVTSVNGKDVSNLQEFYARLSEKSGKETWFDIIRDGSALSTMRYKR